jgi:two-component system nitrate/nitrite response regulator NarL
MRTRQIFGAILVGKNILLREGIARILHSANFRILASVACADELPPSKPTPHPQLFLLVHTGNDVDPTLEQIELLKDRHPGGRIAIIADHYRLSELVSAFRAGANGYFVDVMTCDILIKSLELVMMGETIFPPAFLSYVLDTEGVHQIEASPSNKNGEAILVTTDEMITPQLSPREKSILRCLIEGDSNKSIARKMDIAEATVKVHVKAILRKIRVQNRTQAAIWGMNNGSLARAANDSSPLSSSAVSQRLPNPVADISEIRKIEPPASVGAVSHTANHVAVARIDRLLRKGIS